MTRVSTFTGATKTVAAGVQTITFTPQDIPSTGLVKLTFGFYGANINTNAVVDRVRVRAGGDLLFDCTFAELQAYQQAYAKRQVADLAANNFFSIPFHFLDAPDEDSQDVCQFPAGREIQVEIVTGAGALAGTIAASWTLSEPERARFYPKLYSSVMNFQATANNQRYPFAEAGIVRGLIYANAGVARAQAYISGKRAYELPGIVFAGAVGGADLATNKDYFDNGLSQTTRTLKKVSLGTPATVGGSYILLDTSGFAGTAEPLGIYAVVPMVRAA